LEKISKGFIKEQEPKEQMHCQTFKVYSGALILALLSLSICLAYLSLYLYKRYNALSLDPLALSTTEIPADSRKIKNLVIFIGDSRAKQWGIPKSTASITVINLGIGGHTSAQTLARSRLTLNKYQPAALVIQAGINDLKTIALFPK
jgi:hypothetical protein